MLPVPDPPPPPFVPAVGDELDVAIAPRELNDPGYRPSKKSIKRTVDRIHALTEMTSTWQYSAVLIAKINRALRGWANYFSVGTTSKAYRAVDSYTLMRVRRWLRIKHRGKRRRARIYPDEYLYETVGLVRLTKLGRSSPWAKA